MKSQWTRREVLKYPIAASLAAAAMQFGVQNSGAVEYSKPVPGSENLTAYLNQARVIIRWQNLPLTAYRANPAAKYPYFYPVNGPVSGLSLTSESALPYPHHRGLWFGCDPLNGGNYWSDGSLDRGQVKSVDLKLGETTKQSAEILDRCDWIRKDAPSPLQDERKFTVTVLNDRLWTIDADLKITARQDVSIKKAKHSFFAIRAAADISPPYGGTLINSEGGTGAKGTYGKEAKWCGYFGKRSLRPELVEGITVMTHPKNPFRPVWFTREYGHLSPSPFNFLDKPWKLPRGKSIQLKYRVALHAGDPQEAQLDKVYKQWLSVSA